MKEKTTVLIADDNQEFSQTLANYIQEQEDMEVIGIAKDGEEAIDMITNATRATNDQRASTRSTCV